MITSAERLLLEKERKAWQSLLRVLSHEMNNSLTPIASVSQSMKQKLKDKTKPLNRTSLHDGVSIINERAESLSTFIASYSQLSHLPQPNKSAFSLLDVLSKIAALFDTKVDFSIDTEPLSLIWIEADKNQLEQVLINLFKNAHEAMQQTAANLLEITCSQEGKYFHLHIHDFGTGIANQSNLFVPFYSTKPQGSGIGLTLCRQIMSNHGGLLNLQNRVDVQGVTATISLPVAAIVNSH